VLFRPNRHGYSIEQMIAAVTHDLEDLLNTRWANPDIPREYPEVGNSIVFYGLPDLVSLRTTTPSQQDEMGKYLETIIRRFESRLRNVRVTLLDPGNSKEQKVRYRVDARLNVDPSPEVPFETVVDLATGHYSVQAAAS